MLMGSIYAPLSGLLHAIDGDGWAWDDAGLHLVLFSLFGASLVSWKQRRDPPPRMRPCVAVSCRRTLTRWSCASTCST